MRFAIVATALVTASSAAAQVIPDLSTAPPIAGNWSYAPTADGSEAVFANPSGYPQLWVRCTRSTRRVSIARQATVAAPLMDVWTSSATRSVAASFDPATGRLAIEFANFDPLLDALANSRGRIGLIVGSEPGLIVPAWAEIARVIEDCRA